MSDRSVINAEKVGYRMNIVLASSSPNRRAQFATLQLPFRSISPDIDETPMPNEQADALVRRLSIAKAHAIDAHDALVIGSDQVAALANVIFGKPHTAEAAAAQLRAQSGKTVCYYTGVALRNTANNTVRYVLTTTTVRMRTLTDAQIADYVAAAEPLSCAGSLKAEGLGICLIASIESIDRSAIIGLPLIATTTLLAEHGVCLPLSQKNAS